MPSTMKIEFTGEFKTDIEKRGQATAVHLMGEAFDALKAKMVELGLLNVSGDIRTVPERAPSVRKAKEAEATVPVPEPSPAAINVEAIGDLPDATTKRHRAA